jgi:hypothetical protein
VGSSKGKKMRSRERGRMKIVSDLKVHHTATVFGTDKFIISISPGAVASRAPPLPFDGVITWKSEKCRLIFWQCSAKFGFIPAFIAFAACEVECLIRSL